MYGGIVGKVGRGINWTDQVVVLSNVYVFMLDDRMYG